MATQVMHISQWYTGSLRSTTSLADEAFREAKVKFETDLTKDEHKVNLVWSSNSLENVRAALVDAHSRYEAARKDSKAKKWLVKLAERIQFYGGVLDVFAQHHPEYVALAWGSIKFLLTATLNNEKTIATIAKAMARIADTLPRVQLQSILYPTDRMRTALVNLYAYMMRFFIRAHDWYSESKLKGALNAVLRPVELRYTEILEQIEETSRTIDQLAVSGQQAELRDMHLVIQKTDRKVEQALAMMQQMSAVVTLQSNTMLDTNVRLTDLQFDRIMATLRTSMWTPREAYEHHYSLRRQRLRSGISSSVTTNFWKSAKMCDWASSPESTLSIVSTNFQARFVMRDLCVDIVEQLKKTNTPFILAMKIPQGSSMTTAITERQLLKYLIKQAINLRREQQSEKSMALSCAIFHDASTDAEWFGLLENVLAGFECPVYIIVDLELLDKRAGSISWTSAFESFFAMIKARALSTKIKVLFVSYGAYPFLLSASDRAKFVIPARTEIITARQRRAGRIPDAQVISLPLYSGAN